ncbi:MAG: acyltransferase [Planctomycetota bacterium]|jgi:fucose 4-O-acetylase-like acetyltransferase|nr:acyltransferase [Planctomycetota bacterium]
MRVTWVDNAKGLAIIVVVFCHVCIGLTRRGMDPYPGAGQLIYRMGDNFGAQVFFFLAGLFVESSLRKRGKRVFILGKVETVLYPYVIFSLLQGSMEALLSKYTNMKITFSEVLTLFIMPRAQFWFLFTLFPCLVIIAVFHSVRFQTRHLAIAYALGAAAFIATPRWYNPPQLAYVTHNIVFLLAGMLYARLPGIGARRTAIAIASAAAIAGNLWMSMHPGYLEYRMLVLPMSLGCIAALSGLAALIAKTGVKLLEVPGRYSMEIYVLHILACAGSRIILEHFFGIRNWTVHMAAGTVLGLAGPIVAYKLAMRFGFKFLFVCPVTLASGGAPASGGDRRP